MKFIDWFAGVGGFRRGMELAGHKKNTNSIRNEPCTLRKATCMHI